MAAPADHRRQPGRALGVLWLSRLHAMASCGHRLVYGVALALLITIYFFLAIPTDYNVEPSFMGLQPVLLAGLAFGWRAVGHPIRASGIVGIALLALLTYFFAGIAVQLPGSRARLLAFSRSFPDPTMHELLSRIGPDGPYIVIGTISILLLVVAAAGLTSAVALRFIRIGTTGRPLARLDADVRGAVAGSGDEPAVTRLLDGSRRKGWIMGAGAAAVLLSPFLLSGRERSIPGAAGLAGILPEAIARIVTFLNDRAWAVLLALILATLLWRMARWNLTPEACFVLSLDRRPPILLLRSFRDDHAAVAPAALWKRLLQPVLWPVRAILDAAGAKAASTALRGITRRRIEEVAAESLRDAGPFIAIGDRDDRPPELGAFRAELPDDDWKGPARRWIRDARLIVMVMGTTPSVQWELQTIVAEGALAKLILLMPPTGVSGRAERWGLATDCLAGTPWHAGMVSIDPGRLIGTCFAADGRVMPITGNARREYDYNLAVRIGTALVVSGTSRTS
jgi:hypothetical protein